MKQGNRKVYSWIAYVLGTISVFYNYIKHSDQSTGIFLVLIFAGIYLICINVAITSVSINEKKPNFILGLLWVIIPSIFLDWMLLSVIRVTDETIVVVPIIQLIVLIFTIIAKKIFLNSNEYDEVRESAIKNHEKKKAAEEEKVKRDMERQKELDERNKI